MAFEAWSRSWINMQPSKSGHLELDGDPGPWIKYNPASRLLVRSLDLNFLDMKAEIGDYIGELMELTSLCIQFGKFRCLPNAVTRLPKLEKLKLKLWEPETLPQNLHQLVSLRHLCLECCNNIIELPANFGQLKSLTHLSFLSCANITKLPENLGQLKSLTHLFLYCCKNITELPANLGQLKSLTLLSLEFCKNITELPANLGQLKSLTHLFLSGCDNITELPANLGQLKSLTHLSLPKHLENGHNMNPLSDIARFDEASLGEPEMEFISDGGNNHQALEIRQNMNPKSDMASVDEAGCEELIQDIAHVGSNHHDLENGQNNNPQSDIVKCETQGKEISVEMIQSFLSKKMRLVDAAKQLGVSRSTLKRRLKEFEIEWPRSRKGKHVNAKKRKHTVEQPSGSNTSEHNLVNPTNEAVGDNVSEYTAGENQLTMPNHESCSYNAFNSSTWNPAIGPDIDTVMETQCHIEDLQHDQENLGRANERTLLNSIQHSGTSSTFIVKATYKKDIVKFEFSLMYSIDKLYEEVGKRLKLEVSSFKLKHVDQEKDLILMACISDLEQALSLSRSLGTNVVRLVVVKT